MNRALNRTVNLALIAGRSSPLRLLFLALALATLALGLTPGLAHSAELVTGLVVVPAGPLPKSADRRLHDALATQQGRAVVINFWASWCAPCSEEMPALQRLSERWRDRGLSVITVAVADNPTNVEDFFWEISADLPVVSDHEQVISRSWSARALPSTVILDRRHRIRLRGQGPIDWDAAAIDEQLKTLFK